MNKELQKNIEREIFKHDVVSFDIFDTLLVRPYVKPTDVFVHMEKHYSAPFFSNARINAEITARQHLHPKEDITLDDIYNEIDDKFKSFKQKELDWEEMVLRPNPLIMYTWNTAKKLGKKIVIASDMYLPTEFIAKVLKKNGFDGYDKLYVSGDLNATKRTGNLFDLILKDCKEQPSNILHIGDNEHSDYLVPHRKGFKTTIIPTVVQLFLDKNTRVQKFYGSQYHNLGTSILISILAIKNIKKTYENYWNKLGYEYAGPVIYAYTRWIEQIVKLEKIDNLLFVARDGYTLQKVFNTFNKSIKNSYVYAPRFLNLICRLDYNKRNIHHSSTIINFFAAKNIQIAKLRAQTNLTNWIDYHNFIQNNKNLFILESLQEKENYQKYLSKIICQDKKVAIVDTITSRFSSQKIIQFGLNREVVGLFWSIQQIPRTEYEGSYQYKEFVSNDTHEAFTKNWNFMEFLMTSPEYPIKQIRDGKPIYETNPTKDEVNRHKIYPFVSNGAVDFAKEVKQLFNNVDIYLTNNTVITWINCLCDTPTKKDFEELSILKHAADSGHTEYMPIFGEKIPIKTALLHPKKSLMKVRKAMWKTKLQSFMLALSKPVTIKINGIRAIRLFFFPTLHRQYVNLTIRFSDKWFYVFNIGNKGLKK